MDFNEICTNLVPYPRGLHFILPAMAPLPPTRISLAGGGAAARAPAAAGAAAGPAPTRAIEQAFMEVLQPNRQLMEVQLKQVGMHRDNRGRGVTRRSGCLQVVRGKERRRESAAAEQQAARDRCASTPGMP